ncbi:MAG: hypothetical protein QG614_605 [Patescibacteria group bacterium]|nr:hypothetical protein [Patescibacteria group bacterium]
MNKTLKIVLMVLGLICVCYFAYKYINGKKLPIYNQETGQENIVPEAPNKISELNLLFVGDIMLDRAIRKKIQQSTTSSDFITNYLTGFDSYNKNYDYVVANLEGPITPYNSKTLNSDGSYNQELTFTFPTSSVQILNLLNIKMVSLSNNHTANFGKEGFADTLELLDKANLGYFGNPYNSSLSQIANTICRDDICIAFVGYNQFAINNKSELISKEIKRLRDDTNVDFIIVYAHFGEEYQSKSNKNEQNMTHEWVDAGADLVIGTHPHVVQEEEIYKRKYIYYSLGNYIFDQWFNENVKTGLALDFKFIIDQNGIKSIEKIKEIKVYSTPNKIEYREN